MSQEYLLGIDVGTYESKGVVTTLSGEVVAHAAVGHELSLPGPGLVEHDAEATWWHDFVTLCRQLLRHPEVEARRIRGVGVSGIGPCVLPVDRAGRPLRPAILYGVDTRATEEIAELERELGRDAIYAVSGSHLSSQSAGPKILWLRKHEPHVWAQTDVILTCSGYLAFKLTGEQVLDHYTATAYAPLYDLHHNCWATDMARPITPLEKLPRLLWSMEVAGAVTAEAARETGLAAGTPVVAGTADAAAEALSAGMSQPGDLMVMYGSTAFFIQKTTRPIPTDRLWSAIFLEPNTYVVAAGMATSGSLTRWFRDHFAREALSVEQAGGPNAYAALAEQAASSPPGSKGLIVLPYFAGERTPLNDPDARGLIIGLTLSHRPADVYRALLEGVGYGIRHNIDAMREAGAPPTRILAVGGGARNPLWLQIVSDIADIEQYVPNQNYGASYGDAFMAGVGVGLFANAAQVADWVQYERVVRPDAGRHALYDEYYQLYRQLYEDNAGTMHRLARLGAQSD